MPLDLLYGLLDCSCIVYSSLYIFVLPFGVLKCILYLVLWELRTRRSVDDVEPSCVSGVDENQLLVTGFRSTLLLLIGCWCGRCVPVEKLERVVSQLRVEQHLLGCHVDRRLHAARCRRIINPPCLRTYTTTPCLWNQLNNSFRRLQFNQSPLQSPHFHMLFIIFLLDTFVIRLCFTPRLKTRPFHKHFASQTTDSHRSVFTIIFNLHDGKYYRYIGSVIEVNTLTAVYVIYHTIIGSRNDKTTIVSITYRCFSNKWKTLCIMARMWRKVKLRKRSNTGWVSVWCSAKVAVSMAIQSCKWVNERTTESMNACYW